MEKRKRLIHLQHCRGIGWKGIAKIVAEDDALKRIYDEPLSYFIEVCGFNKKNAEIFYRDLHSIAIDKIMEDYHKENITMITIFDKAYPKRMKAIYDPPWVLYTKGHNALLHKNKILSVVGTRRPTDAGLRAMRKVIDPLIQTGWTIVSGMAVGVDGAAHQCALQASTIAVLGSGLLKPYPRLHLSLFNRIIESHLAISEYPPNTPPNRWQFPERNRIISGLSLGTLVIEAREKSGSLITADQALEQGREVFALPGNILNENTIGTHRLIQQGAKLVTSAEDILMELDRSTAIESF
ncbi:DNA processing protein DprA [Pullulanibacillus camelliae]|uniref:DNA processing protein DprA n=1 Tax=Pullulanibacillus camelliae TaxID=1707096 RepID=A0A8J2VUQ2_9BACL|nr:DNA-processing protein DprA [Pullulanibacillus camelliae]GGE42055.1 DNA processing protein DprA [Pullulanibacillus camelliae]